MRRRRPAGPAPPLALRVGAPLPANCRAPKPKLVNPPVGATVKVAASACASPPSVHHSGHVRPACRFFASRTVAGLAARGAGGGALSALRTDRRADQAIGKIVRRADQGTGKNGHFAKHWALCLLAAPQQSAAALLPSAERLEGSAGAAETTACQGLYRVHVTEPWPRGRGTPSRRTTPGRCRPIAGAPTTGAAAAAGPWWSCRMRRRPPRKASSVRLGGMGPAVVSGAFIWRILLLPG